MVLILLLVPSTGPAEMGWSYHSQDVKAERLGKLLEDADLDHIRRKRANGKASRVVEWTGQPLAAILW